MNFDIFAVSKKWGRGRQPHYELSFTESEVSFGMGPKLATFNGMTWVGHHGGVARILSDDRVNDAGVADAVVHAWTRWREGDLSGEEAAALVQAVIDAAE